MNEEHGAEHHHRGDDEYGCIVAAGNCGNKAEKNGADEATCLTSRAHHTGNGTGIILPNSNRDGHPDEKGDHPEQDQEQQHDVPLAKRIRQYEPRVPLCKPCKEIDLRS